MSPKKMNRTSLATALPKARTKEIVVQELKNDTLVYDLNTDKAHHLNETVATVWKHCDGETTAKEIAQGLAEQLSTKVGEDFVWLALDELQKANLLDAKVAKSDFTKLSRRKVLFRYAPIAVALPVVMSLVAPASAQMGSCAMIGEPCSGPPDCCPPVGDIICVEVFEGNACQSIAE